MFSSLIQAKSSRLVCNFPCFSSDYQCVDEIVLLNLVSKCSLFWSLILLDEAHKMFDALILKLIRLAPKILKYLNPQCKPSSSFVWTSADGIRCAVDVYEPAERSAKPAAVHINLQVGSGNSFCEVLLSLDLQGAGFVIPNLKSDSRFCRFLADRAHCIVLDFDYPKSPESKWPIPQQTIKQFIEWAVAQADQKGYDVDRLSLGGFSSGGLLALVVASLMPGQFRALSVFYPSFAFFVKLDQTHAN